MEGKCGQLCGKCGRSAGMAWQVRAHLLAECGNCGQVRAGFAGQVRAVMAMPCPTPTCRMLVSQQRMPGSKAALFAPVRVDDVVQRSTAHSVRVVLMVLPYDDECFRVRQIGQGRVACLMLSVDVCRVGPRLALILRTGHDQLVAAASVRPWKMYPNCLCRFLGTFGTSEVQGALGV
eukprot:gene82-biopygen3442